jgi:hypothetical protein
VDRARREGWCPLKPAVDGMIVTVALHDRAGCLVGQIELPATTKLVDLETLRKLGAWRTQVAA